jgi:histidinol phosphatase-like PHP family hydrolase
MLKEIKNTLAQTYPYRLELHAHTNPASHCGKATPEEMVQLYLDAGFDGVVITNHFSRAANGDLSREAFVEMLMSDYQRACKAAEGTKLKVYLGVEARFEENANDYLLFGVDEEILGKIYDYLGKGLAAFRAEVKLPESVLIQAHPFRDRMLRREPELMDGIEVFNMHPGHNSRVAQAARLAASIPGCIKTVGTDFHHPGHEGLCALRVRQMPRDSFDIAAILRSGDYVFELGGDAIVLP